MLMTKIFKQILLLLAILVAPVKSYAQFEIGANMGASISHTNLTMGYYDYAHLSAFYPELKAGYVISDYFKADLGLSYATLGFEVTPQNESAQDVKLRYFSIPLYVTAQYPVCSKLSLGVLAGMHFNFINHISADYPFACDYARLRHEVGFLFGGQVEYRLTDNIGLSAQYRINPDFYEADKDNRVGRFAYHNILVGFTYYLDEVKEAKSDIPIGISTVDFLF